MYRKIFTLAILLIGIFIGFILSQNFVEVKTKTEYTTIKETQFTEKPLDSKIIEALVTQYRVDNGIRALKHDDRLCEYAEIRIKELSFKWEHRSEEEFAKDNIRIGITPYIGENLSRNYANETQTLTAWLDSPSHKKNIVDTNYTITCVVVKTGTEAENYVVQIFK